MEMGRREIKALQREKMSPVSPGGGVAPDGSKERVPGEAGPCQVLSAALWTRTHAQYLFPFTRICMDTLPIWARADV